MENFKPKQMVSIDLKTIFGVVRSNKLSLVEQFVAKKGVNILNELDSEGFTPMHWAVYDGSVETVRYLLNNNAIHDSSSNKANQSPLHWACAKGRLEMVSLLVEKGINVNQKDSKGYTPLITASQFGNAAIITYLISLGADLDAEDNNGDNALHWAVYKAHPDVTRLLILFGVNPKTIDKFGQTILHLACLSGNLNIVQQLIEQDFIDSQICDRNGKKAIDLARNRGYSSLVDYLERHEKMRRKKSFESKLKMLLFGPVGNSKCVFLTIQALYIFYEYPIYLFRILPDTWSDHMYLNLFFILNSILMWFFYYSVHLCEPGFLRQNTTEYHSFLKQLLAQSSRLTPAEWTKNLARLCHTCKAIKPYRASHCRACNRCILAYDHHCPYIQNCVGYKNRPQFFFFVLSSTTLQLLSLYFFYILFSKSMDRYIDYPGVIMIFLFAIMAVILLFQATFSVASNYTANETVKKNKYDYFKRADGSIKNIFDKGLCYNIKYYFHLIEPSYLETEEFSRANGHVV
ncbi:putative S-acyltransferase 23 [Brachionus plicatilis]|uniref:Palmitoyltransferase n=1 Tax=Brachionus plicatilis TaxID=10195 RepID=A0A3M7PAT8_BRAPC|nr:putative S-acyltransferase 23 [Brachionus plicatilis]